MFEFMDGVVDALEETGKVVVDGVVYCLIYGSTHTGVDNNSASMGAAVYDMEKGA